MTGDQVVKIHGNRLTWNKWEHIIVYHRDTKAQRRVSTPQNIGKIRIFGGRGFKNDGRCFTSVSL